ncbi:sugar transferase [Fulvivirgaceae bacterium BMA12]|uniref:Sugar transferase n=1 Tax=Agaribacillus aureus TaxID=3051825 RepID=A0ABT8L1Q5_9BACT|nr:sugar transferase [Fulvivirgaceae bacterium BMA12]
MEVKKILYVGNDNGFIDYLKSNMPHHLEIHREENGFLATEYLDNEEEKPQVILSELNIPGVSAFQFHEAIRNEVQFENISFILLTRNNNENVNVKALAAGIDDVFIKSVGIDNFRARLDFLVTFRNDFHDLIENHKSSTYKIPLAKRIFDIAIASTALLLISPLLILIAILIKLESKGPIYYVSKRVGTGYHIFDFYKLRSMYMDADSRLKDLAHLNQYTQHVPEEETPTNHCEKCEELGEPCSPLLYIDGKGICENLYFARKKTANASAFLKIKDDPRITKVGRFIRKTSVDELPQLINVIKGDMSIVGNRPLPLYEAEQLTSDAWTGRFNAPAGITGLWQISKRGKADMSDEERKGLDNQYASDNSFIKDLTLILKTVPALFQKENV